MKDRNAGIRGWYVQLRRLKFTVTVTPWKWGLKRCRGGFVVGPACVLLVKS